LGNRLQKTLAGVLLAAMVGATVYFVGRKYEFPHPPQPVRESLGSQLPHSMAKIVYGNWPGASPLPTNTAARMVIDSQPHAYR
jgi:hypothetical protein